MRDSFAATAFADTIDRSTHALTARFTAGLSPIALAKAYGDWAAHLAFLPGKQMRLAEKAARLREVYGVDVAVREVVDAAGATHLTCVPASGKGGAPAW